MNNQTDIGIKFTNKVTNERKIEKYRQELAKIYGLLQAMDKGKMLAIEKTSEATTDMLKEQNKTLKENNRQNKKMAGLFDLAFDYTKLRIFTRTLKSVSNAMGNMTKQSASFVENMNLLDVAFNNNTTEATKFVNKMSEMYGLDESWGYRTVGIFKQLANAMNLSVEAGNKLATIMPQFAIDISSLYNIDTGDAVSILTSALAGQTKPARRLGADITQSTLQQTLDTAGIKEYVANLSYAEKRLVIVASLLQQVSEANNDWGRTIDSVANQTRILSEQWSRLTRVTGNLFLPMLQKILPYLNGILMVFIEIIKAIGTLIGFDPKDFDYFGQIDESVTDLQDGLEGANKSAKKLNGTLRSFDRLNNITTNSGNTGALGVGTGINANIMKLFNDEVEKYNQKLTNIQMKATKIRDSVMEWLGFTKKINPLTKEISFEFDHMTSGTVLGVLFAGGALVKGLKVIWSILQKIGIVKTAKETTKAVSSIKTGITGLLIGGTSLLVLNNTIKDISKNGANAVNVLGSVAGTIGSIVGFAKAGSVFGGWGAVIGGLIGALGALVTATMSYENEIDKTIEKSEKVTKATKDYVEAINSSYAEIDKNVSSRLAEHEQNKTLLQELDSLIDRNGKIKQGYETRANFIVNELNSAYGTELKIVGKIIKGYDNQKQKLEELIKQEEIEIILQGKRDKYMKALETKSEVMAQYEAQKQVVTDLANALTEAENNYKELSKTRVSWNVDVIKAQKTWEKAQKKYNEAGEEFTNLRKTIVSNNKIITEYQDLTAAKISGDLEKINEAIDNSTNTYVKNGETVRSELKEQLIWLQDEYYDKLSDMTEKEYDKQREKIIEKLKEQSQTVKEQTPELAEAWNYLATTSSDEFLGAIGSLPSSVQQQVVDKMYEQGYKISEELQKGINAQNPTIKFKADTKEVSKDLNKILSGFGTSLAGLGLSSVNIKMNANGDLPRVGQLMVVNEKGPELVGQIGGQSFVANQNQIVDFLQREIGNAKSGTPQTFNFYLDANNKLATYTLDKLQNMAKSNGQPIEIGG